MQRIEHDGDVTEVLIVDDDPGFREQAGQFLRAAGFVVVGEADVGAAALTAAAALRPAAALVDVGLPDMDGFEVARRLTAGDRPPRVLLTSSDTDPPPARALARCGAVGFVAKIDLSTSDLRAYLVG